MLVTLRYQMVNLVCKITPNASKKIVIYLKNDI